MKEAELLKLETRESAEYPQEEKYPSGTVIFQGLVVGSREGETPVRVGFPVYMGHPTRLKGFKTSTVEEIEEQAPNFIQFKTRNSRYKLIWKD